MRWLKGDAEAAVRRLTACLVDVEAWLKAQLTSTEPHQDPGDVVGFLTAAGESQRFRGTGGVGKYQRLGDNT